MGVVRKRRRGYQGERRRVVVFTTVTAHQSLSQDYTATSLLALGLSIFRGRRGQTRCGPAGGGGLFTNC